MCIRKEWSPGDVAERGRGKLRPSSDLIPQQLDRRVKDARMPLNHVLTLHLTVPTCNRFFNHKDPFPI